LKTRARRLALVAAASADPLPARPARARARQRLDRRVPVYPRRPFNSPVLIGLPPPRGLVVELDLRAESRKLCDMVAPPATSMALGTASHLLPWWEPLSSSAGGGGSLDALLASPGLGHQWRISCLGFASS